MRDNLFQTPHITYSAEETHQVGKTLGEILPINAIVALMGDLGAGKTTFTRGMIEGIGSIDPRTISSPTFTLLNIYQGAKCVYHFDLYRLPCAKEFFTAGFDEYFSAQGICCIEWAEKIEAELPTGTIKVTLSHHEQMSRQIQILVQ